MCLLSRKTGGKIHTCGSKNRTFWSRRERRYKKLSKEVQGNNLPNLKGHRSRQGKKKVAQKDALYRGDLLAAAEALLRPVGYLLKSSSNAEERDCYRR